MHNVLTVQSGRVRGTMIDKLMQIMSIEYHRPSRHVLTETLDSKALFGEGNAK